MFSGIIEEQGIVADVAKKKKLFVLKIKAKKVLPGTKIGNSVAIDGVCLTVTSKTKNSLTFDVMAETIRATTLKFLTKGSKVNLERPLKWGDRLGGHYVSGHVDRVERVKKIIKKKNYVEFVISLDKSLARYMVAKGSICIHGVSLTVGSVGTSEFSVHLIPHTLRITNLGNLKAGDSVNIETDILAKYFLALSRL